MSAPAVKFVHHKQIGRSKFCEYAQSVPYPSRPWRIDGCNGVFPGTASFVSQMPRTRDASDRGCEIAVPRPDPCFDAEMRRRLGACQGEFMAQLRPLLECLEDRCTPATSGVTWPDGTHLTLSFAPDGTPVGPYK